MIDEWQEYTAPVPTAAVLMPMRVAPFNRCALVTGGSGFFGGFLVHQLDQVARGLGGGAEVHNIDVAEWRPEMPKLLHSTHHRCLLTDPLSIERVPTQLHAPARASTHTHVPAPTGVPRHAP